MTIHTADFKKGIGIIYFQAHNKKTMKNSASTAVFSFVHARTIRIVEITVNLYQHQRNPHKEAASGLINNFIAAKKDLRPHFHRLPIKQSIPLSWCFKNKYDYLQLNVLHDNENIYTIELNFLN